MSTPIYNQLCYERDRTPIYEALCIERALLKFNPLSEKMRTGFLALSDAAVVASDRINSFFNSFNEKFEPAKKYGPYPKIGRRNI